MNSLLEERTGDLSVSFGRSGDRHSVDMAYQVLPFGKRSSSVFRGHGARGLRIDITYTGEGNTSFSRKFGIIPNMMTAQAARPHNTHT